MTASSLERGSPASEPVPTSRTPDDEACLRDALSRLNRLARFGVRLGLERMRALLTTLGDPQQRYPVIHVAGTNGKGSTSAMLASCLGAAGLRVGLYTSPHLCRFCERIQVDGREIGARDLLRLLARVLEGVPGVTFFEAATAVALCHFAEQGVDIAVLETGLGGRLDATNVVVPRVSVLTSIDLDHVEVLGDSLVAVAREKAGIIKPGVPVVAARAASPEVEALLRQECKKNGSPLWLENEHFQIFCELAENHFLRYRGPAWSLDRLTLGLAGEHQHQNAAVCLAVLEKLNDIERFKDEGGRGPRPCEDAIRRGLEQVRWPGRLEWFGETLLDGAHNAAGSRTLARSLEASRRTPFALVMGILGPKDPRPLIEPLLPWCGQVVFTRPRSARALDPSDLAALVSGAETAANLSDAWRLLEGRPGPRLITGSLYLVGEARAMFTGELCDPVDTGDPLGTVAFDGEPGSR